MTRTPVAFNFYEWTGYEATALQAGRKRVICG